MGVQQISNEKSGSIPALVRELAADSEHLVSNEVRLAKLSVIDGAHVASRGLTRIFAAFGIAVIAATLLTALLGMLIGRLTGHGWLGALIVGIAELLVGMLLFRRGQAALSFEAPPNHP